MAAVLTIPNVITLIRLVCIPVFVWLIFSQRNYQAAAYLLAVLGATDWVDGYIARHFNQVTTVGKVFDPTVDRLMLVVAAVSLLIVDAVPLWFALVALGRELFVVLAGALVYAMGAERIDVRFVGKAGALLLMVSMPLFLISIAEIDWANTARLLAYVFGVAGLILSWYSVIEYRSAALEALQRGRAKRRRRLRDGNQDDMPADKRDGKPDIDESGVGQ